MRTVTDIFIIFLICLCAGCAGRASVSLDDPASTPRSLSEAEMTGLNTPLRPIPSTLNIPVEIKTSVIENLVHDLLSGTIHNSDSTILGGLTRVKISARRNGSVKITAKGDELSYTLPIMINIRVSTTVSAMGLSHTEHQDVEAGIAMNLRSKVSLKNDWRVAISTKAAGYRWTSEPTLKARFLTIPIKPVANYFADKLTAMIGPMIDNALANSDIIKKNVVAPLWEQLYTPIPFTVPETQETFWLRFNPIAVYLSNINGQGSSISALVGIRTITEAVMADTSATSAFRQGSMTTSLSDRASLNDRPNTKLLPDFSDPPRSDSSFVINLYADIPYDRATAICKETFNGRTFRSGFHKVKVNDIEIIGANANGMMTMRLDLSGSLKGIALVSGRAVYNEKENTLELSGINFEMETADRYQKAKHRLLKGIIIEKMKPMIKFPLSGILNAETLTKTLLTNYRVTKGTKLNGKITQLTIRGVETTETGLRAVVLATGTARLTVTD